MSMHTMLDKLYTKLFEVDGVNISMGYIGVSSNKVCYITFNEGEIEVYHNHDKCLEQYRTILKKALHNLSKNTGGYNTTHTTDELPY